MQRMEGHARTCRAHGAPHDRPGWPANRRGRKSPRNPPGQLPPDGPERIVRDSTRHAGRESRGPGPGVSERMHSRTRCIWSASAADSLARRELAPEKRRPSNESYFDKARRTLREDGSSASGRSPDSGRGFGLARRSASGRGSECVRDSSKWPRPASSGEGRRGPWVVRIRR